MKTFFVAAALLAHTSVQADPSVHPDYAKLKLYRNYFRVVKLETARTRYQVWFSDRSPISCKVSFESIQDLGELATATATNEDASHDRAEVSCSWGAFGIPPSTIPPLPADKKNEADVVLDAIKKINPNARDLKIVFKGKFAQVEISEQIPTSLNAQEPAMRFQNESTAEFAIDKNFLTITDAPGVTGSGGGRLCSSKCDQAPQWIPYIAPPVLGGRLVLELSNKKPDALAIKSKQDLMKAVLKVAKQMAAKSYTPNLSRILAQQGTGLLPKSVNAKLELQFDIYARSEKRAQISEYLKLEFPLNDAVRGSARFTHSVTSLGLHVDATLDLSRSPQDGQLEINVKTDRGETTSLRYSVETKELIRDGDRAVAPYLSINLVSPSSDEISLPGFGDFTSIDAYPGNELR